MTISMKDLNRNFYQSALLISTLISLCFAVGMWNPIPELIGLNRAPYSFAKYLGLFWLSYAIFKGVTFKKWMRICLCALAVGLFICQINSIGSILLLWSYQTYRVVIVCVLIATIGFRPVIGKTFRTNLGACIILFVLWAATYFMTGWQTRYLVPSTFFLTLMRTLSGMFMSALSLSIISLSLRDEVRPFYDNRTVKTLLVTICILCSAYVLVRFSRYHCWIQQISALPLSWYLICVVVRFLWKTASVIGRNCHLSWRDVLFKSK